MKKLRLKKKAKKNLIISLVILIFLIFGITFLSKCIKQKNYEKTYEYKLINIGYDKKDANYLEEKLNSKDLDYILNKNQNNIYIDLLNEKYFIKDYFYDYINYYEDNSDLDITKLVEKINTKTNKEYYTDVLDTDASKKELMLVNKYYKLSENYVPEDLVSIPQTYSYGENSSQKVTKDTYEAFLKLWNASHENGFYLMVSSSYRDYSSQQKVYDDYKTSKGNEYADTIAARPGHSEHQTGLALDIFEKGTTQKNFQESDSYKWLKENAYKYGFIERFPEDKTNVTGYKYESWHYRYVGVKAATYIHENNITFDEYYAYFVK